MRNKRKILLIYPQLTTFIKKDQEILADQYQVYPFSFNAKHKALLAYSFLRQFLFLLLKGWKVQLIVSQFSGYHAFLPGLFAKVFNIPHLIISAGTDAASFPSIGYGNYARQPMAWFTQQSFKLCDHIAPVDESLLQRVDRYSGIDGPNQGIFNLNPGLDKPATPISYGFDANKWQAHDIGNSKAFITVAYIIDQRRYILKGIDLIMEVAPHFPDCTFTVVGWDYQIDQEIPKNVKLIGPTQNDVLIDFYQQHRFYFQLSISEGHPNALCEAMLAECVPVVSDVTSMPTIVGDTGFVLASRDAEQLKALIQTALDADSQTLAKQARDRIADKYPLKLRTQKLQGLAEKLIQ